LNVFFAVGLEFRQNEIRNGSIKLNFRSIILKIPEQERNGIIRERKGDIILCQHQGPQFKIPFSVNS